MSWEKILKNGVSADAFRELLTKQIEENFPKTSKDMGYPTKPDDGQEVKPETFKIVENNIGYIPVSYDRLKKFVSETFVDGNFDTGDYNFKYSNEGLEDSIQAKIRGEFSFGMRRVTHTFTVIDNRNQNKIIVTMESI